MTSIIAVAAMTFSSIMSVADAQAIPNTYPQQYNAYFRLNGKQVLNSSAYDWRNNNDMGVILPKIRVRSYYHVALLRMANFSGGYAGICGQCINILNNNGRLVMARVLADCPTCEPNQIELMPAAYALVYQGVYPPRGVVTIGPCPNESIYPW
ncbi:hypothetical protein BGW39_008998 [Mortierella sp. 14UC]|nr:hypothetical protein BGW39_008998 [Mortierella sp. 14UC]